MGLERFFIEGPALHLLPFAFPEPERPVGRFFSGNLFTLALPSPCVVSEVSPPVLLPEALGFRMADQSTVPVPPELQVSDITESEVL